VTRRARARQVSIATGTTSAGTTEEPRIAAGVAPRNDRRNPDRACTMTTTRAAGSSRRFRQPVGDAHGVVDDLPGHARGRVGTSAYQVGDVPLGVPIRSQPPGHSGAGAHRQRHRLGHRHDAEPRVERTGPGRGRGEHRLRRRSAIDACRQSEHGQGLRSLVERLRAIGHRTYSDEGRFVALLQRTRHRSDNCAADAPATVGRRAHQTVAELIPASLDRLDWIVSDDHEIAVVLERSDDLATGSVRARSWSGSVARDRVQRRPEASRQRLWVVRIAVSASSAPSSGTSTLL
jgi:hypothetical protein